MKLTKNELYAVIETLRRNDFKGVQIHEMITNAWDEETISLRRVQEVMKEFKEGRQEVGREWKTCVGSKSDTHHC